ncbi:MAG TPA: PilW family protein [Aggregicoccus sp.]|nr:PilW family protein [Aggregicoccus sp.]
MGRPPARTAQRGFTLLELMVGIAITVIILAAVGTAFLAVTRSYHSEALVKGSVEGARTASLFVERTLRMAGYGLDPVHAFDLRTAGLPGSDKDNHQQLLAGDLLTTDDLAFRYRDPAFLRRGVLSADGTALTLAPATTWGFTPKVGQVLLIACPGARSYTVRRVVSTTPDTAVLEDHAAVPAFPAPGAACLSDATERPFVMLVHELRLRVIRLGSRPYLVAFRNHDAVAGNDDYDPVAADVENFQVAYVMNRPRAGALTPADGAGGNWILGDDPDTDDDLPSTAATAPTFDTGYDDVTRFNAHPANVRALRVSFTVRSARKETSGRVAFAPESLENQTLAGAADGRYRTTVTTSVRVPNLQARAFFVPPIQLSDADPEELNVWGG